jgi:outer membrane biosynthesis protein TonB
MAQEEKEKPDESTSSRRPQAKETKPNPAPEPEPEMATVAMDISKPPPAAAGDDSAKGARAGGEGLRQYYLQHIHDLQLQIRTKTHNLNRLEAQRNDLNSKGQTLLLDPSPGVRVSPEP